VLGRLSMVVTDKLHVGIVARALGTTSLAVPTHQKTKRFYDQLCASEDCIPMDTVDADAFSSGLHRQLSVGDYELPSEVRQLSERNRELLKEFIRGLSARLDY